MKRFNNNNNKSFHIRKIFISLIAFASLIVCSFQWSIWKLNSLNIFQRTSLSLFTFQRLNWKVVCWMEFSFNLWKINFLFLTRRETKEFFEIVIYWLKFIQCFCFLLDLKNIICSNYYIFESTRILEIIIFPMIHCPVERVECH